MNWPLIVAEMLEALAAILRKYLVVPLDAPVQVRAEVRDRASVAEGQEPREESSDG
jgi:hypothetical protein